MRSIRHKPTMAYVDALVKNPSQRFGDSDATSQSSERRWRKGLTAIDPFRPYIIPKYSGLKKN